MDVFLSNKIPGTESGWTDELIRIASIFNEFDGQRFENRQFSQRFELISNRLPDARDPSGVRDLYGAYLSYLGLMSYEHLGDGWMCRLNPQAKDLLCNDLPDANAYMRLVLSLFQYPNPIGAFFKENGSMAIVPNALQSRQKQVIDGVKIVPFRAILRCLITLYKQFGSAEAYLSYGEIWEFIFQNPRVCTDPLFNVFELTKEIKKSRSLKLELFFPPAKLRNLHLITHSGLVFREEKPQRIRLTTEITVKNNRSILEMAEEISEMSHFFQTPKNNDLKYISDWTKDMLSSGEWANYFCGQDISSTQMKSITNSLTSIEADLINDETLGIAAPLHEYSRNTLNKKRNYVSRLANPEETQILREKANAQHRIIVQLLVDKLVSKNIKPFSNTFIDLCCEKPEKILFEVKSCNVDNQLNQVRKAVSQLYEYRYRHNNLHEARLVLALEQKPSGSLEWLLDYLVQDRQILLCWLEGEQNLVTTSDCFKDLDGIVDYSI